MSAEKYVYMDQAATTRISDRALRAMMPCFTEDFGNPSSLHGAGRDAEAAVEQARARIAACFHAEPSEIFFTSGGSEADNWAIRQAAALGAKKGKRHLISSAFEHHAVLHTLEALEKDGFEVTLLPVHENGLVRPEELEAALREDTALVTVMYVNNEVGTVQPVEELGRICREKGVLFHTDAVQAAGHLPIDVKAQNIDMMSLSAHKFHGPKGVGALYVRKGIALGNLIYGGGQERGRRAGTENVPAIAGMAAALEESLEDREAKNARTRAMQRRLTDAILQIPCTRLNGDRDRRVPGNLNFCFEGIEGESLLLYLDLEGICASSGSACTSGSLEPSHVLLALGLPAEVAHGSLRLSFDETNSEADADRVLEKLPGVVERLRSMSPVWKEQHADQQSFGEKRE